MSPVGAVFVPFPPKPGTNMLHTLPPPIVELVYVSSKTCEKNAVSFRHIFTFMAEGEETSPLSPAL